MSGDFTEDTGFLDFGDAFLADEKSYLENIHEEKEKPFSYFDVLDAPRILPDPVDLTLEHLKEIEHELGLIKLCWPEVTDVEFENRTHFPPSYLKNSNKEKLILLYAENFRRQFCHKYPDRKPLYLASENECGMQKMVCTTIRPTTLPYPEIETWQQCVDFVGNQLKFEPLEEPTLFWWYDEKLAMSGVRQRLRKPYLGYKYVRANTRFRWCRLGRNLVSHSKGGYYKQYSFT